MKLTIEMDGFDEAFEIIEKIEDQIEEVREELDRLQDIRLRLDSKGKPALGGFLKNSSQTENAMINKKDNEQKINELFDKLVPPTGKADTVAGEIVRAVFRIIYRDWNDGDHIGVGYGKETCNPPARYLGHNAGEEIGKIISKMWGEEDDELYKYLSDILIQKTLEYLEQNPKLEKTFNNKDMWDYHNDEEDSDDTEW